MNFKLISIIIPAYNAEKTIEKCINSIASQSYKNIEIIVINDGSKDNTEEIIKKMQNNDSRIKVIQQENSGAPVARNHGMTYAKGKYILFFDSDDILKDKALEIMYNEIEASEADLVIGNLEIKQNDTIKKIEEKIYENENIFECSVLSPYPGTKLYNNQIIKDNNIKFANVRVGQDLNFFLKYLLYAKRVKTIKEYIAEYTISNTGISRTYNYNILDIVKSFENIKKEYVKQGKEKLYNKYIAISEIMHYGYQVSKIKFIQNKEDRKIMILYFNRYFKEVSLNWNNFTKEYKKIYYNIKLKLLFRYLYISKIYSGRSNK